MKLAEALQERADLNRKIEQLRSRLYNNSLIQEGEKPLENPRALLKEHDMAVEMLQKRIAQINLTNSVEKIGNMTVTDLIAKKDGLLVKLGTYRELVRQASQNTYRARGAEIKIIPTVSVAQIQKEADRIAKVLRELDNKLQEHNWKIELIE